MMHLVQEAEGREKEENLLWEAADVDVVDQEAVVGVAHEGVAEVDQEGEGRHSNEK